MSKREKILLALFGGAGLLYLLTRTQAGQGASGNIVDKIAQLIGAHEGERLTVYQDQGGLWTIGKGHLIKPGEKFYPYGGAITPQGKGIRTISQIESDALFVEDTAIARSAIARYVTVPLSDNQRAALTSLAFNIGAGAFGASTLVRMLNAANYQGAADQFLVWKKIKGEDSDALLSRRQNERQLFLS